MSGTFQISFLIFKKKGHVESSGVCGGWNVFANGFPAAVHSIFVGHRRHLLWGFGPNGRGFDMSERMFAYTNKNHIFERRQNLIFRSHILLIFYQIFSLI